MRRPSLARTGTTQGITETFTYDELNQVATAQVVGSPSKTFAYNSIGNITTKSDAGTYIISPLTRRL